MVDFCLLAGSVRSKLCPAHFESYIVHQRTVAAMWQRLFFFSLCRTSIFLRCLNLRASWYPSSVQFADFSICILLQGFPSMLSAATSAAVSCTVTSQTVFLYYLLEVMQRPVCMTIFISRRKPWTNARTTRFYLRQRIC